MVGVRYLLLIHLYMDDLGKLIHQKRPGIPQVVRMTALDLNDIDLLVQKGDLARNGVDLINRGLQLVVDGNLKVLQPL